MSVMKSNCAVWAVIGILALVGGCRRDSGTAGGEATATFSLAWSEYPSWSVFGVAEELGLIDGAAGQQGTLETKHGIDIELKEVGYDSCLNMFSSGDCDAVCITNMDALIISPSRDVVAVLPTSTSNGADACLVTEAIADIEALKQHPVYGLEKSVSEYCFVRCLEKAGFKEEDFKFTNQEPASAAMNLQQGNETHQAIMVWNPFVLQTLRDRTDVRVLFDSSEIPGEIVDMVAVGRDSLQKPDAEKFIKTVIEAFYEVNRALDDPNDGDEVLVALGKKFSNLGLEDMRLVVQQTVFYKTPAEAQALLGGDEFQETMKVVTGFCVDHGLVTDPSVGYGPDAADVKLRFDASYID
jgi:NitT/TauT family transport system substrate-binding protein